MSDPRGAVASLSPELFLERRGRRVRSAPIKGTRPRPADPVDAERQRAALLGSQKDHAENVMIVDLVRNDLGRVCVPGSVRVEALAEARAHAGVWHLVSEVRGLLRGGAGDADLVRAAFPPGSVTGAPKVAAMNVIAELESTPRELYTGAIGFASPLAGLELSVAIRTFEVHGKRVALGVGGGIVADSLPVAEAAECDVKAAPLLAAIGGTLDQSTPPPRVSPPPPRRLAPRPVSRPGPGHGVFETLLVLGGRPVDLERHLGRLRSSVQALYGTEPPLGLAEELLAAAWGLEQARLRVDVRPASRRLTAEIKSSPVKRREPPRLEPMTLPGGLGAHKWSDRRLLDALGAAADGEPLLCDLDGLVLESARANVFLVEDGSGIATPPADGRILPGVTRGRVIESARGLGLEVREEPFDLGRLARASEIFVTGAIGGVEPAALGSGPPRQGPVTRRLAQEWLASLQPGPKHR
jgi:para-aminobenzoate synthetase/4-amino-4-deoxychorismate lyase